MNTTMNNLRETELQLTYDDVVIEETNKCEEKISEIAQQLFQPIEKQESAKDLSFIHIERLEDVPIEILEGAISIYQAAFARSPYFELFSEKDAKSALQEILEKRGDLVFGTLGEQTVSLAGGYKMVDGTYYLNELAVSPHMQRQGFGRATLNQLLEKVEQQHPARMEIRTTAQNVKALALYKSKGFVEEVGLESVSQPRQDGTIAVDLRVYLSNPPLSERERLMKLKRMAIAFPSGNTTAVIFDQFLTMDRKSLNTKIMTSWKEQKSNQPEIEQCCFVTTPKNQETIARVEMFGGEFCGNATRSVIGIMTRGEDYEGKIEVSGVSFPLNFNVKGGIVTLEMPLPKEGRIVEIVEEGTLVHLDGITHFVTESAQKKPREILENLKISNQYDFSSYPAFGVSYFDPDTLRAEFCVWVREVDTIFDETACGSGTCSIGVALAMKEKCSIEQNVIQPSGQIIRTIAIYDREKEQIENSSIAGKVEVLFDGEFEIG